MLYEFLVKIREIKKTEFINIEALNDITNKVRLQFNIPPDVVYRLPEANNPYELMVKMQVSIASRPPLHDRELEIIVQSFKDFMQHLAGELNGFIGDGFYNNTKTFSKLF
jgi:hypothetical protein